MQPETLSFFNNLRSKDPANNLCVDCGANHPQWATISHGALVCLKCAGIHRGLGVHISFVRSTTMDSWSSKQLDSMRLGGNKQLLAYFKEIGIDKMPINTKYSTLGASWFRQMLKALTEGETPPPKPDKAEAANSSTGAPTKPVNLNVDKSSPLDDLHRSPSAPPQCSYHDEGTGQMSGFGNSGFGNTYGNSYGNSYHEGGSHQNTRMSGFGNPEFENHNNNDNNNEWGCAKSGGGIWGVVAAASSMATSAAQKVQDKIKNEGMLDTLADGMRSSATWVGQKGRQIGQTVTDEQFFNNASEKIQGTASWLGSQIGQLTEGQTYNSARGDATAQKLAGLTSGKMEGFGSDSLPPPGSEPLRHKSMPPAAHRDLLGELDDEPNKTDHIDNWDWGFDNKTQDVPNGVGVVKTVEKPVIEKPVVTTQAPVPATQAPIACKRLPSDLVFGWDEDF